MKVTNFKYVIDKLCEEKECMFFNNRCPNAIDLKQCKALCTVHKISLQRLKSLEKELNISAK